VLGWPLAFFLSKIVRGKHCANDAGPEPMRTAQDAIASRSGLCTGVVAAADRLSSGAGMVALQMVKAIGMGWLDSVLADCSGVARRAGDPRAGVAGRIDADTGAAILARSKSSRAAEDVALLTKSCCRTVLRNVFVTNP